MEITIEKLFAQLLFWVLELLDVLERIFRVLCGLPFEVNGEEQSIVDIFLDSSIVVQAFLSMMVLSVIVMSVSVVVTVIKNIISAGPNGERKPHLKTAVQGIGSIITSLVMAVIMITGIGVANGVLGLVDGATRTDNNGTLAEQIFLTCVEKTYVLDKEKPRYGYKVDEQGERIERKDSDGNVLYCAYDENGLPLFNENGLIDYNKDINLVEDKGYGVGVWYELEVVGYEKKLDEDGNPIVATGGFYNYHNEDGGKPITWTNFIKNEGFGGSDAVDKIFGVRKKSWMFEDSDKAYVEEPIIEMDNFNMFMCYLAVVMIFVALISSMLGLVKRLFDLVFLFITLPLISGTIPLDDGARFKKWRETVVSKVVLAYGAVISVNIYLLMLPTIMDLSLGENFIVDALFKVLLLIGGGLAINGGQLLISRLLGTSAEESREMAGSARALMAGVGTAVGGIKTAKRVMFGSGSGSGGGMSPLQKACSKGSNLFTYRGGVWGSMKSLGSGAVNLAGNALAGDAYRDTASKAVNFGINTRDKIVTMARNATHLNRANTGTSEGGAESGAVNGKKNYGLAGFAMDWGANRLAPKWSHPEKSNKYTKKR